MKKNSIRLFVIYLYAFFLIYLPNFSYYIRISGVVIYLILTFIYLLVYLLKKDYNYFAFFKKRPVFMFIILNILFTIYYAVRTSIAGTSILDLYNLRFFQNIYPILILVGVLIVYHELDLLNYTKEKKYKFIINLAVIQSSIAVSMIFIPTLRNIAYNIFYNGSENINIYISTSRLYGICDGNYTYSFQILTSFLALFSFIYAYFFKNKKYYFVSAFIILTTILNGRTGIIIYFIGLLLFLLYIAVKEQKIVKTIKISCIVIVVAYISLLILQIITPATFNILKHAYNDILNYLATKNIETESGMLANAVYIPDGIVNKIFGSGYRIYARLGYNYGFTKSSDIGFVNDLFMGGVFTMLFLYYSFINMVTTIRKNVNGKSFENVMCLILIVSMIISNIKGELFRSQMQMATILIILVFMMLEVSKNDKIFNNNSNI